MDIFFEVRCHRYSVLIKYLQEDSEVGGFSIISLKPPNSELLEFPTLRGQVDKDVTTLFAFVFQGYKTISYKRFSSTHD